MKLAMIFDMWFQFKKNLRGKDTRIKLTSLKGSEKPNVT